MIIKYKYGFIFDGILYGWKDKKLFRLPQMIGLRFYPLKEVGMYKSWYVVHQKKKSLIQLQAMTVLINQEVQFIQDSDCPF